MRAIDRSSRSFIAMLISLSILSACEAPKEAREMAAQTTAAVAAYEKEISNKIKAEKAFYQKDAGGMREYLTGRANLGTRGGDESKQPEVKRTLVYGRIVNGTHRDARLAAEAMIFSPKVDVMGKSIAFVRKGVEEDLALYREISARRTHLRESFLKELAKIDQQKARLAKVKKGLSKLSKSSDPADRFKLIAKHAKAIKDAIDANNNP